MISVESIKKRIDKIKEERNARGQVEAAMEKENRLIYEQAHEDRFDELRREKIREQARRKAEYEDRYGRGLAGHARSISENLEKRIIAQGDRIVTRYTAPPPARKPKRPRQQYYVKREPNRIAQAVAPVVGVANALNNQGSRYSHLIYDNRFTGRKRNPNAVFDL